MALKLQKSDGFNGEMLHMGYALRGLTRRQLAAQTGIALKTINAYIRDWEQPTEEHLQQFVELLQLPPEFFYRQGNFPVRDRRYPLDMFVPLAQSDLRSRAVAAELLRFVPDDELPNLIAYMHEIAEYGDDVVKFE